MLSWPLESAASSPSEHRWWHSGSNQCLDFHGDPVRAKLTVFSDGNHHMALEETLAKFVKHNPDVNEVFYATTPPAVLITALNQGGLRLGNLMLSRRPQIFISPQDLIERLQEQQVVKEIKPFMASRGNVLLVQKGNPCNIRGLADLYRDDVKLFISNPETEKASYSVYYDTLLDQASRQGLDVNKMAALLRPETSTTLFGELIHHREAPQALASDRAQVAMVYYHLALRYTRIFPDQFEFISLGAAHNKPEADGMVYTEYWCGLLPDSDEWGKRAYEFLSNDLVTAVYEKHGLRRP